MQNSAALNSLVVQSLQIKIRASCDSISHPFFIPKKRCRTGLRTHHGCFPFPSEITCSGAALVNHSDHAPSYRQTPGWPHRWAARAMWQAVTPEPQVTQKGFCMSTPACWKSLVSSSTGCSRPDVGSMKLGKGMLIDPGIWPGSVSKI